MLVVVVEIVVKHGQLQSINFTFFAKGVSWEKCLVLSVFLLLFSLEMMWDEDNNKEST